MVSSESESASVSPRAAGTASPPSPTSPAAPSSLHDQASATSTQQRKGAAKVTKRRAARACASCRARKVRCDVVEGAPCGNCRWDNVECIVQESRRRRKHLLAAQLAPATAPADHVNSAEALRPPGTAAAAHFTSSSRTTTSDADVGGVGVSNAPISLRTVQSRQARNSLASLAGHVAPSQFDSSAYQTDAPDAAAALADLGDASNNAPLLWPNSLVQDGALFGDVRTAEFLNSLDEADFTQLQLPAFIKQLPDKIVREDVQFLQAKGALALPSLPVQNALLRAYIEYVHPYMPLMDLHDFLNTVNATDGLFGQVSLLLYQAVMFAATAFVDVKYLREAGFPTRRAARRAFFQRTRLLYDFDYESDRLVIVQSLLLMTYWYETPDDQKDTWHWMGVAVSLAHTIGLHRNPANMAMSARRQRLWKRIWWSCFMRDRLIALGMRRPTRIKDEDFDVPALEVDDFEIDVLPLENQLLGPECEVVRDVDMQRELAALCVEKAKICVLISHMLLVQYSMLNRENMRPENTTASTMMLFPNKDLDNVESVGVVDEELAAWHSQLPECCRYRPLTAEDAREGRATLAVQRNLLHMVHQTAVSALHRPQFLPASPLMTPKASAPAQEVSRTRVREAASKITAMAVELHHYRLERFLPTTGVTVILPAMIIHLLEMKSAFPAARARATRGFRQCMRFLEKLREMYAAADFATGFLEAALRKAAIDVNGAAGAGAGAGAGADGGVNAGLSHQAQQAQQLLAGKNLQGVLAPGLNFAPAAAGASATTGADDMSTPPPEDTVLFALPKGLRSRTAASQGRYAHGQDPSMVLAAAAAGHTPPQTEFASPSASGSSDGALLDLDLDVMGAGQDDFDWQAITGTQLDFDQWLQFPAEGGGVTDADEAFKEMFGPLGEKARQADVDNMDAVDPRLQGMGMDGEIDEMGNDGGGMQVDSMEAVAAS